MIIYLAGPKPIWEKIKKWKISDVGKLEDVYWLSSFWEAKTGSYGDYAISPNHILDSGAFSAFSGKFNNFDWDDYCNKYIKFIKQTNNSLFFEMDIDVVVGLEKVVLC